MKHTHSKHRHMFVAPILAAVTAVATLMTAQVAPAAVTIDSAALYESESGQATLTAWRKAEYHFTPEVQAAYLAFAKKLALQDLAEANEKLPEEFLLKGVECTKTGSGYPAWISATGHSSVAVHSACGCSHYGQRN